MPDVEVRNVTRRFGPVRALEDVSLEVTDGEFCVIVGPSGCGKSTLLRVIAGLEGVDRGEVRIAGEDVTALAPRDRDVAFVFQSYALYPHLTVRQNLEFPLRMRGVAAAERGKRVGEVAELLGVAKLLDRKPKELSGGERQRVAMGRAVVRRPKVFLFDEPLSNLDAKLRSRMRLELIELHRRIGATAVYVTHDQVEAMTLGEKVVVMNEGRILQIGAPREVYERPADLFVAGFIGSPTMNLFEGEVRSRDGRRRFESRAWAAEAPEWVPEGAVTLGARPEDLAPGAGPVAIEVRVVEDLGAERFVVGEAAGAQVCYRASGAGALPQPGERISLAIRSGAEHWFRNGRRVEPQ